MWLMVPPPIEFGANVVQRMQLASSLMSSQILDLLRIDHLMTGNVFYVALQATVCRRSLQWDRFRDVGYCGDRYLCRVEGSIVVPRRAAHAVVGRVGR